LAAVSTRAWESNYTLHAHSMYKDSWVQDKHKQNSDKGKAEYRQNSQEGCSFPDSYL